jgi:hypothetical protein
LSIGYFLASISRRGGPYCFLLIKKRREMRSANPVTERTRKRLKLPELKIASLYCLNKRSNEKAITNTRKDIKPFKAAILFW